MSAPRRRMAVLTLAAATAGLVMGCSAPAPGGRAVGGSVDGPTAAPPGSATTSAASTAPPDAGGADGHPAPAGGNSGDCTLDHLAVRATHGGSGSGHRSVVLVFTNTGNAVCRLFGYPGVAALNGAGVQIEQAKRTTSGYLGGLPSGQTAQAAYLSKGESAAAIVEALAFNSSDGSACTAYAGLLVTPPNETHAVRLAWDNDGCSNLQIHPVVLGSTGQGS